MDGLVNRESFSKPINMDVSIPRLYKYTPIKTEMYKTEEEKEQAKGKTFDCMDFKGIDVVNVDEWLNPLPRQLILQQILLLTMGTMKYFKHLPTQLLILILIMIILRHQT